MKLIKNPWNNLFYELVCSAEKSIKISAPFVKSNIVAKIYECKNQETHLSLITSFKLMNYYLGVSDLEALQFIINKNGTIRNYQKLHSKVYIFDNDKAVITSGNLTANGLIHNYEYGIYIDDKNTVKSIVSDYSDLYSNELTGVISNVEINKALEIISKAPRTKSITLPKLEFQKQDDSIEIFTGGEDIIRSSLSGWTLEVFNCLLKIPSFNFTLTDIYAFESYLKTKFPENFHVKAKIRQQLQNLRDIGLVEFLGNGNYRKLFMK